jgi:hypothetical protein
VSPDARAIAETLNGVHSNAAGFQRWLEQRDKGATTAGPMSAADHDSPGPGYAHPHAHPHPH